MYSFLLLMQKVTKAKNTFGSIELLVKPAVRHEQYVLIIHSNFTWVMEAYKNSSGTQPEKKLESIEWYTGN